MSFCLLVPVKTLREAKTRLDVPPVRREALMRAFARDALDAAARCAAVAQLYVVSDEETWDDVARLPDHGDGDLNAALRHAERGVRLRHPGLGVAAMCGDLPALDPDDLAAALDLSLAGSLGPRWYVADADTTGTTLLVATAGVDLDPHFGAGSAARHEASGARPLRAAVASLRRDVDTGAALEDATRLGVGTHTRAALDSSPAG